MIEAGNLNSVETSQWWDLGEQGIDLKKAVKFYLQRIERSYISSIDVATLEVLGLALGDTESILAVVEQNIFDKQWMNASQLIDYVLRLDNKNIEAIGAKSWLLASQFKFDEAYQHIDEMALISSDFPEAVKYTGILEIIGRSYKEGIENLDNYIRKKPNDGLSHYMKALAYFHLQKNHDCTKAANLGSAHGRGAIRFRSRLLFYRCRIKANLSPQQALADLEGLIKKNPRNTLLRIEYIRALADTDQLFKALSEARQAVEQMSYSFELRLVLGEMYERRADFDQALLFYNDARKLAPKDARASIKIGEVFLKKNKFQQAAQNFETAARLDPEYPGVFLKAARAYRESRNIPEASRLYQQEMEERPSVIETFVEAAEFFLLSNAPFEVPKLFQKYSSSFRDDPRVLYRLAQAYFAMKEYRDAVKTAKLALVRDPEFAEPYRIIGDVFDYEGQYFLAKENYEKYLYYNPASRDADLIRQKISAPPY